jgi:hypothetical protein
MPGLSVSLTFGGRRVPVDGFGIPLVVRYLLEMCQTTAEAQEILARLPYHLATNHQGFVEWPEQAYACDPIHIPAEPRDVGADAEGAHA